MPRLILPLACLLGISVIGLAVRSLTVIVDAAEREHVVTLRGGGPPTRPSLAIRASAPRQMERLPATETPPAGSPHQGRVGGMTLMHAIGLAVQNSDIVRVASGGTVEADPSTAYDVQAADARVLAALAEFDTSWESRFYTSSRTRPPNAFFGPGLTPLPNERDESALRLGVNKRWQTGAQTSVMFNPDPTYLYVPNNGSSRFNPSYVGELEFSVNQPLLRGAGRRVNRAPIQISSIATEQSAWEFKKAVMASLRSVAEAYWDLHASYVALRSIDEVIPLLEEVVRLQEENYKTEWVIYADVAKAYAQLHEFRQRRLAAQSTLIENELTLRNLLRLPPADGWRIVPTDDPLTVREIIDPDVAVADALHYQPDLVRRRLEVRIRELELLVAQNGLQPNLDFQALYRMNGVGQQLDTALRQMYSAEYPDWLVGFTFSVPLGNRQAAANARAAELELARANGLLHQEALGVAHRVSNDIREIDFAYREYEQAYQRLRAAGDWLQGSRLRYQNPQPEGGSNWLVQSLNDYLAALRFRTDAATDAAEVVAQYNTALIELEETKGTLLQLLNIDLAADPCRQAEWLPPPPLPVAPSGVRPIPVPGPASSPVPASPPRSAPTHIGPAAPPHTSPPARVPAPPVTPEPLPAPRPAQTPQGVLESSLYAPAPDQRGTLWTPSVLPSPARVPFVSNASTVPPVDSRERPSPLTAPTRLSR